MKKPVLTSKQILDILTPTLLTNIRALSRTSGLRATDVRKLFVSLRVDMIIPSGGYSRMPKPLSLTRGGRYALSSTGKVTRLINKHSKETANRTADGGFTYIHNAVTDGIYTCSRVAARQGCVISVCLHHPEMELGEFVKTVAVVCCTLVNGIEG